MSRKGCQSTGASSTEAVAYINSAFAAIVHRLGLRPDGLAGIDVLELGPGDNLGLALRFLAAGARRVVCLDRFDIGAAHQREIYQHLLASMTPVERRKVADLFAGDDGDLSTSGARLRLITGIGIEDVDPSLAPRGFDAIVSVAVGEHLYDSDSAFAAMDRLLRPGGVMFHQIDFGDHGMFTKGGLHPLTFLTVPNWVYRLMQKGRAAPNRRLIDYYRSKMGEFGYDAEITISQVVGEGAPLSPYPVRLKLGRDFSDKHVALIREIRPHLIGRFRDLSDEDLIAAGISLTARKSPPARNADWVGPTST